MNIILGGGLVALIARDILGSKWKILPMGRSMFYSFTPPLADNRVVKDNIIDSYMDQFSTIPIYTKVAFSVAGQLTHNANLSLKLWLQKVYGADLPLHADPYWRTHLEYWSYGDCKDMYRVLQERYADEILNNDKTWKKPKIIGDHKITTETTVLEYDRILSTIPLHALLGYMGQTHNLPGKDMWCYHLLTDSLDFEGSTHVFVCDTEIDFYKVTQLDKTNFVFYSTKEIERPATLFMALMPKFELVGETKVPRAIPCGPIPDIAFLKENNISCVGSLAAWDDCQDVGTCIKRLLKL